MLFWLIVCKACVCIPVSTQTHSSTLRCAASSCVDIGCIWNDSCHLLRGISNIFQPGILCRAVIHCSFQGELLTERLVVKMLKDYVKGKTKQNKNLYCFFEEKHGIDLSLLFSLSLHVFFLSVKNILLFLTILCFASIYLITR